MIRTQVQLPDEIYLRAKELARTKEISLAELTRRGLELILSQYPDSKELESDWHLPVVRGMGWKGLTHEQIRDAAQESDLEAALIAERQDHARG